jgi:hypothetical protein
MDLPPEKSPFWTKMEDDVAEERWPLPSLFSWMLPFRYRGPGINEVHRRASFEAHLKMRLMPLGGRLAFWALLLASTMSSVFASWRGGSRLFLFAPLLPIVGLALELTERWLFDRSVFRYRGEHRSNPAASLSAG